MIRISSRTSRGTIGRPGLPCRTFQVQNSRKPLRCQAITVAALTMKTLVRHSFQTDESQTHRIRSVADSFGLFTDRCRTPSWWRRARISTWSAARLRNDAKRLANRAEKAGTHANRTKKGKPQFINDIDVCENHRALDSRP